MGAILKRNMPCLDPACGSSDARQIYQDGTSFCFSCSSFFNAEQTAATGEFEPEPYEIPKPVYKSRTDEEKISLINTFKSSSIKERQLSREVVEFFGVKIGFGVDGSQTTHYYPYNSGAGYHKRELPKEFSWINSQTTHLFGKERFSSGGKRLVITEGEIDAMSVAQASLEKYKKIYPVVSVSSASSDKSLLENREWIRSFDEVVLCFDEDEPGRVLLNKAIKIIGVDKVKITRLGGFKDANELLLAKGSNAVNAAIWDAGPYIPSGILTKEDLWKALEDYNKIPSLPYPDCLEGVNTKLKGMRLGEIALFISGTGSGKSTVLREVMLHVLETTDDETKIGVVSLEESPAETARKLAGMAIQRNPAKDEIPLEDLKKGFDKVFSKDRVIVLDHQGSMNDSAIVEKLEYMALNGCKYLFIDHITILVSEGSDDLRGTEAQDKVMNDLLKVVKRHNVWIGLVSHLRKVMSGSKSFEEGKIPSIDDIRGSGSIKQISMDILAFARNLIAQNEAERNTIKMRVLKCRYTGLTGNIRGARYVYETGRLVKSEFDIQEEFTQV
jgi:twinkle protein